MIMSKVYNYYEDEFDKVYQPSYPPYESKAVAILTAFGKAKPTIWRRMVNAYWRFMTWFEDL
tara:strand:- start:872 stop:1057 length:186 start_codon:yes stop_codon:yes gene_type:complete